MKRPLWFRAKIYGWGWYPVTWEGWAVTFGYIGLFVIGEVLFMQQVMEDSTKLIFTTYALYVISITVLLLWICYKTGEKPRWRWGK